MFGTNNAGKMAFYRLVGHLKTAGFHLLDTQYMNPFTRQLGAFEIPREQFRSMLSRAMEANVRF
jgi:leucyl/phenylalanyl-tRNA--protein transferase